MRIYAMTATFGKLEHETLRLQPGLNVIHAPNEWGKSTWCAFLMAMFYGLNTREKSTRQALADKEHYAPWSGSPMSGRIDLCWEGRDITIERRTKGRIPLGDFRAYETATGLAVPELDAANCGLQLLGVERSVFARSGFVRLGDIRVTEDEALRRRLNALVSTGDDSGAGELLGKNLRDLKNKIRYHRTGLLPQAQQRCRELEEKLEELARLERHREEDIQSLKALEDQQSLLQNHQATLAYQVSQRGQQQVTQGKNAWEQAKRTCAQAEAACDGLPAREMAEEKLAQIARLQQNWEQLHRLPPKEPVREEEKVFRGLNGEEAKAMAARDARLYSAWMGRGRHLWILMLVGLVLSLMGAWFHGIPGLICTGVAAAALAAALLYRGNCRGKAHTLEEKYGTADPAQWLQLGESFARRRESEQVRQRSWDAGQQALAREIRQLTDGNGLEASRREWMAVVKAWDAYHRALADREHAKRHCEALQAMAKPAPAPQFRDELTCSQEETAAALAECVQQHRQLQNRLGQYQGRMDILGEREVLLEQLTQEKQTAARLERTYTALTIAQETLQEATAVLQQRFAPKITRRAQAWMEKMTGGRYDRLRFDAGFALQAGAAGEDTLREAVWRSEGTADQLYLSLRLAVAQELMPDAPLVLDDALVRFDDVRLFSALKILKELGKQKQVLLFSCQSREQKLLQNT